MRNFRAAAVRMDVARTRAEGRTPQSAPAWRQALIGHVRLSAKLCVAELQHALACRIRIRVPALHLVNPDQVVQRNGHTGMALAVRLLDHGEQHFVDALRLAIPPLQLIDLPPVLYQVEK